MLKFCKISQKCKIKGHYSSNWMNEIHIFEISGYLDAYLIHQLKDATNFSFWLPHGSQNEIFARLESHFCKNWLNFRISTDHEVFILWSQLSPYLNQNYRLSIQNFNIEANGDPKKGLTAIFAKTGWIFGFPLIMKYSSYEVSWALIWTRIMDFLFKILISRLIGDPKNS